MLTFVDEIG